MSGPNIRLLFIFVSQFIAVQPPFIGLLYSELFDILEAIQLLSFSSYTSLDLTAYLDSDLAGDINDQNSTTGFCIFVGPPSFCGKA